MHPCTLALPPIGLPQRKGYTYWCMVSGDIENVLTNKHVYIESLSLFLDDMRPCARGPERNHRHLHLSGTKTNVVGERRIWCISRRAANSVQLIDLFMYFLALKNPSHSRAPLRHEDTEFHEMPHAITMKNLASKQPVVVQSINSQPTFWGNDQHRYHVRHDLPQHSKLFITAASLKSMVDYLPPS